MEVDDESDSDHAEDNLSRQCTQIMRPRHLPQKRNAVRFFWSLEHSVLLTLFLSFHYHAEFTHFNAEKSLIRGVFEPQKCHAKLAIFVPIDSTDLRAVIVPKAGVAHNHPSFPQMKVPCAVRMKYANAVEIFDPGPLQQQLYVLTRVSFSIVSLSIY